MVFPSVPVYLDPPDWYHHQQQEEITAGDVPPPELLQTPAPYGATAAVPAVPGAEGASSMTEAIRPTSMAEGARLAKIPQPEPSINCPRCNSTNTKFCYFNNYSLSQPRHFCKACRRYWTRGGTLRNVPVGGGCRRNKRNKSSSAAASASSSAKSTAAKSAGRPSSSSTSSTVSSNSLPQLPFMASMQYTMKDYGANFIGIQQVQGVDNYQVGTSSSSLGFDQQWRMHQFQQFPLVGGLEPQPPQTTPAPPPAGMFPFDLQAKSSASGLITQLASVKMEDNNNFNNPHHQYLGVASNTEQFWGSSSGGGRTNAGTGGTGGGGGGGWQGDLSGFTTSSSGNLLY